MKLYYQEKAKGMITALLAGGRFPHAILLEGEPGSGRTAIADYIAASLLCTGENKPCGCCSACGKVEKSIHPDYIRESGSGSRSFHVDQVRRIKSDAYVKPNEGNAKVYLLQNTQDMTVQAQNALLKVMEEPPANAFFILTVDNRSKLLATVLSRCIQLPVERLLEEQVQAVLPELAPGLDEPVYAQAAASSGGNLGKALLQLREKASPEDTHGKQALEQLLAAREYGALQILSAYDRDREGFLRLLEEMSRLVKQLAANPGMSGLSFQSTQPVNRLQAVMVADIIEESIDAVRGNGNISLWAAALCSQAADFLAGRA